MATANVHALLGPASDPSSGAKGITDCKPGLRVWNSGGGKLVFFFWSTTNPAPAHYCGGVPTGATPPYTGTIKNTSGNKLVIDVPLPSYVSSKVLGAATWGSLVREQITWKKLSSKSHGKTHYFVSSVGCKSGKRPGRSSSRPTSRILRIREARVQSFSATGSAKCK